MSFFEEKFISPFIPKSILLSSKFKLSDYKLLIHFHIISLFSTGFFYVYCRVMGLYNTSIGVLVSFVVSILGLVLLKKNFSYHYIAQLFTFSFFITFLSANIYAGLGINPAMVWFILFPLIPVSLLGLKSGVFWTLLTSLTFIILSIVFRMNNIDLNEINSGLAFHSAMTNMLIGPLIVLILSSFAYKNKDAAIIELEKTNKEKQYLLSVLFHDLSNSLHVALNLTDPELTELMKIENMKKSVSKVHLASKNMDQLINHVKELQAIESGKKKLSLNNVSLSDVFKNLLIIFEQKLEEKSINIDLHMESDLLTVYAEEVSFSNSVINNIVSNAIKFSPENSTIDIWVREFDEQVEIRIQDYGFGIPSELRPLLFSLDKPTTRAGTKGEEGTGFGLPTAKRYMDMFSGSISYEYSDKEKMTGSLFKIVLPVGQKSS